MKQLMEIPEYVQALQAWTIAKESEVRANETRLEAEKVLLSIVSLTNQSGVNNFDGGLKITTGFTQSIDNDQITFFYGHWLQGTFQTIPVFPFNQNWKPDNSYLKMIKASNEEIYKTWIQPAITTKPSKPSFSIKL